MSASAIPLPQVAAWAVLSLIVIAWSIRLSKQRGRWLLTIGPIAAGAVFGAMMQWPRDPAAAAPQAQISAGPATEDQPHAGPSAPLSPAITPQPAPVDEPAEAAPLLPPPTVVLRGTWTDEDRAVVGSTFADALARVPAASRALLEVEGTGRALAPTSTRVPRYGISATWTLREEPGAEALAGGGLGEVEGWGATPSDARRDAAQRAARSMVSALRATPPAPQ